MILIISRYLIKQKRKRRGEKKSQVAKLTGDTFFSESLWEISGSAQPNALRKS